MMKLVLFLVFAFIATAYGAKYFRNGVLHGSSVVPVDGVNNQINVGFSGEVALTLDHGKRELYWYFHHTATEGQAGTFNGVSFWQGKEGVRGTQLLDASADADVTSGNGASPHLGWHEFPKPDDEDEDEGDIFEDIYEALMDGELYIQITTSHYTDGLLRAQLDQRAPTYTDEVASLMKNNKIHALTKHSVKAKAQLHGDFVLPHGVTTSAKGSVSASYKDSNNEITISYSASEDKDRDEDYTSALFLTGDDDTQDTSTPHVLWDFSLLRDSESNDENELRKGKVTFPATQYALRSIFQRSNTYLLISDSEPHIRGNLDNSHASTIVFSMAIIVLVALINILF